MPMQYEYTAIPEAQVPRASNPVFQHLLDTYASETSKVVSVWREFAPADMSFKPAEKSSSVLDIMKHQLLSERRFFAEFLGVPEPSADQVLPKDLTVDSAVQRHVVFQQSDAGTLHSGRSIPAIRKHHHGGCKRQCVVVRLLPDRL